VPFKPTAPDVEGTIVAFEPKAPDVEGTIVAFETEVEGTCSIRQG